MITRRTVLRWSLAAGATLTVGAAGYAASTVPERAGQLLKSDLPLPERFTVPLPIPDTAEPSDTTGGAHHYEFTQSVADVEIIPGTTTEIWGYNGQFPGPTVRAQRGRAVTIKVTNQLPVPTSTHLHGGVTPADSDGFPTDVIVPRAHWEHFEPGQHSHMDMDESVWTLHKGAREYEYPMEQPAATLWYHDHRMDFTAPQVWRGLMGMYVIHDEEEAALGLPDAERDVPLILCDRAFTSSGEFKYPAVDASLLGEPGVTGDYHQGVEGDVLLVNGAAWPVMEVAGAAYRFRVLNASNARRYSLALRDDEGQISGLTQIGSDLGLLDNPVHHDELLVAAAERFDVVIDFSRYPAGSRVTLLNQLGEDECAEVMRFDVGEREKTTALPDTLRRNESLTPDDVTTHRSFQFALTRYGDHSDTWTINGEPYDPAGSLATVKLDEVEKWTLTSDFHHPVHIHLGHFQVLSRNGKPPAATDGGWKDTVDLKPFEVVEILIRFSHHRGRYMMHCHNLEHEDMAMMANIDVV